MCQWMRGGRKPKNKYIELITRSLLFFISTPARFFQKTANEPFMKIRKKPAFLFFSLLCMDMFLPKIRLLRSCFNISTEGHSKFLFRWDYTKHTKHRLLILPLTMCIVCTLSYCIDSLVLFEIEKKCNNSVIVFFLP